MTLRSLGLRTDLDTAGADHLVDQLDGGVIRVRTPTNPSYYYGNFLLFPDAPAAADVRAWPERFAAAFAYDPAIRHVCLRWDRPDGAAGSAAAFAGFAVERQVVLTTRAPTPPARPNTEVKIARIESVVDWAAVEALQVATMTAEWGPGAAGFARAQVARHRRAVTAGRGFWLGAWAGSTLAADLGVYVRDGLARYQAVETAARFRKRGICATLVHHAARLVLDEKRAEILVLVAVLGDPADRVYRSVGFAASEELVALLRRP